MSVIAKLMVRQVVDYGTGTFVELGCICENDLMASYATSESDKLFTKYSPWGEMRISQKAGWAVFWKPEEHVENPASVSPKAFYVMLLTKDEAGATPAFEEASAYLPVNCYSLTKFAGDGSRVEFREASRAAPASDAATWRDRSCVVEKLSWKMQVDNPGAESQFEPGKLYWLAFYDAAKFGRDQAIRAAHGYPEPAPAVEAPEA